MIRLRLYDWRLQWHHWRAQRLMRAFRRHSAIVLGAYADDIAKDGAVPSPAFIEWSKAAAEHADRYLTRRVAEQTNEFLR